MHKSASIWGKCVVFFLSLFCSILEQTVWASKLVDVLNVCKYCLVCFVVYVCTYEKKINLQCACPDAEEINWFVFK